MIRVTMILLCLILAGASAGRYQAEARIKEKRQEIKALQHAQATEVSSIQVLRAEIAYLESPDRLASIAEAATSLKPLSGSQLLTADDFSLAFGDQANMPAPIAPDADTILHAIAMADALSTAQ